MELVDYLLQKMKGEMISVFLIFLVFFQVAIPSMLRFEREKNIYMHIDTQWNWGIEKQKMGIRNKKHILRVMFSPFFFRPTSNSTIHVFLGEIRTPGVKEREAWHAAVHGIAKSQTWLSDWIAKTQALLHFPVQKHKTGISSWCH